MNCEYCQSPVHVWFQCPKKPDGWKPARLAKSTSTEDNVAKPHLHNKQALGAGAKSDSTQAAEPLPTSDARRDAVRVTARKDGHPSMATLKEGSRARPDRGSVGIATSRSDREAAPVPSSPAGTQALPVDTNSLQTQKASSGNADGGKPLTQTRPANSAGSSNGRTAPFDGVNAGSTPAPASKFDKKTWQRNYMRTYIRQYREDVKSGKRTPKPRA